MPVEPEPLPDQRLELPGQEVGQPERAGLLFRQLREPVETGEEGVAVRALDPSDAFLVQHPVQLATRAAIGIGHVDPPVVRPKLPDRLPDRPGDQLGMVVQLRRQAVQLDVLEPVRGEQRQDLAGQRPAGEDQRALGRCGRPVQVRLLRRRARCDGGP